MFRKVLFMTFGFIALLLGGIGIVLPVLPTTPFVLLAAGCFGVSSPALATRLENTKYFGEYIRNYQKGTGISTRARWIGIGFLWLSLGISALFTHAVAIRVILVMVGIGVSIHLLLLRKSQTHHQVV